MVDSEDVASGHMGYARHECKEKRAGLFSGPRASQFGRMKGLLRHPVFAPLFAAQVIALLGTGLMTVALGLLAYDLAGARAGAVLGTAYAIKMLAYVGLSPVAAALVVRLPRKVVLVGADLLRAGVALALPFVTEVWQVYGLIFLLQSASATFTPAFQATIPDVLPDERDYTRALSLSRLAYDLENLASPALAALLLGAMGYHWLFAGTVAGFLASAVLVARTAVPAAAEAAARGSFAARLTRGLAIYLATPRLRGLLALNLAAATGGAFVIVNTVLVVREIFGGGERALAVAMMAFGAGSMGVALGLPRLLDHLSDRAVMRGAGLGLGAVMAVTGAAIWAGGWPGWPVFLGLWSLLGACYAGILTPTGRLLRRSSHAEDRATVFTAQFALSHACWLAAYPAAGYLAVQIGLAPALSLLGVPALAAALLAGHLWPAGDPRMPPHAHPDLPPDHPHLRAHGIGPQHAHPYVIDALHPAWPVGR